MWLKKLSNGKYTGRTKNIEIFSYEFIKKASMYYDAVVK